MQIAFKSSHDGISHRSYLSCYGGLPEESSLLEAREQLTFEELIEQDLVFAQCTYRMHRGGNTELMLKLRFDIRNRAVKIAIRQQV